MERLSQSFSEAIGTIALHCNPNLNFDRALRNYRFDDLCGFDAGQTGIEALEFKGKGVVIDA